MTAKGLTRPITRKQARSYKRLVPNGIGVTAIAALSNGRRKSGAKSAAYRKAYASTKALLKNGSKGEAMKKSKKKRLKGAAFKRSAQYKKMMAGLRRSQGGGKKSSKKRYKRNDGWVAEHGGSAYAGRSVDRDPDLGAARVSPAQRKAAKARSAKAARELAAKKRAGAAKRKKSAAKRAVTARKRVGKKYGPFKSVKAKVGGHATPTYGYKGKGGKVKKIPLWAILGAKSKADLEKTVASGSKRGNRFARGVVAAKRKRDRKAAQLQLHGDIFTPNSSARVVPFESWSENMKPNKKKKSKKRRTAAQKAATKKMIAANRRKGGARKSKKRRKTTASKKARKSGTRKRRVSAKQRAAARRNIKKAQAARRKKSGGSKKRRKSTTSRKRRKSGSAKKRTSRKGYKRVRVKGRAKGKQRAKLVKALNKRWGRKKRVTYYNENKRSRRRRHTPNKRRHHRRYRRNGTSMFMAQLKSVAIIGATITAGFVIHRAVSYVLSEKLLAKIGPLQDGQSMAPYRGIFGGVIVAAAGIGVAMKLAPKHAAKLGAGMVTSLLHKTLVTVLSQMGQPDIANTLSGYPDAPGLAFRHVGMGEYLSTNGMGEYLSTNGFGDSGMMQAAAGFGSPMLQAAAGMGMAGFRQAAAGVGEYVATSGLRGIGEFEQAAAGVGGLGDGFISEGIGPDLDSADYALTQAEAMVGIGDIGMNSTVQPTMRGSAVDDAPQGSRAGVFQGSGGIFA